MVFDVLFNSRPVVLDIYVQDYAVSFAIYSELSADSGCEENFRLFSTD